MEINKFTGKYRFLSNFYEVPIIVDGIKYRSVEHAFQAAKATNELDKHSGGGATRAARRWRPR